MTKPDSRVVPNEPANAAERYAMRIDELISAVRADKKMGPEGPISIASVAIA